MSWLTWVALGVVQGLTEFLPVSSSAHLVLAQRFFGLSIPGVLLEVVVHAGTALAVVVFLAHEIWSILRAVLTWPFRRGRGFRGRPVASGDSSWRGLAANVVLATAVTAVIGFTCQPLLRRAFESPKLAAGMLLITGAVLFLSSRFGRGRRSQADVKPGDAVWIGAAQGLAILPGLSRSGLTMVAGLARKLSGEAAARFSFLLSLPAIAGATLVETAGSGGLQAAAAAGLPVTGLALAFAAAFLSGLAAMLFLVRLVEKGHLHRFAWYCWLVGGASLIWLGLA